ncbi:neuronal calcium sensor 2-like [Liolophura sinensis]|uniref:neuronal calcium sensor 2-like n=1 Tax=Liolophura sinensis TaxID=3198878 RepID=UPI003158893D
MGNKSSKKLSKDDIRFLVENTNFSKNEIKQWYVGFMRDCPDGQLTKKKFVEVYSEIFPSGDPNKFCNHVFRSFDHDGSGKIDFKEFLMAINITSAGNARQKLDWAFKMYDIDGNGTIDRSEMMEIIGSIYHMLSEGQQTEELDTPEARTEKIFEKMDVNKDNVLTKDEFINGCLNDECLYQMLTAEQNWQENE